MEVPFIERDLGALLPKPDSRFLVLLTGARQTGKTTLLKRAYPGLAYFNLDAIETREWLARQTSFAWASSPGPAILDEVQKEAGLIDKVKFAWDEGSLACTVMTGSSQILLLRHVRETLAGRVRLLELFPLGVGERAGVSPSTTLFAAVASGFSAFSELAVEFRPELSTAMVDAENEAYSWGGMPSLIGMGEADRKLWLADYRSTFLQRDLADLARINDLLPFSTFQRLVALRVGGLVNYADLARDSGLSADTARRYLEYLRISYQAELLQPWFANPARRLVKSPKVIVLDMGLLRSATATWDLDSGGYFENFLVAEMLKALRTAKSGTLASFWRTAGGAEVDLVLETPRGVLGIEIKNRREAIAGDARHLRALAEDMGERWSGGLVLYRGSILRKLGEPNIWALPSWRLWAPKDAREGMRLNRLPPTSP